MKLKSFSNVLMAAALALALVSGTAMAHGGRADSQKQQTKYPNATRKAPKLDLTSQSDADTINKGAQAYNNGKYDQAKTLLQPFADGKGTDSKYAQVVALQILGNIAFKSGDMDTAIANLEKALSLKVMPNDTYFDMEYELAQFYQAKGSYQKSLDTIEKWRQAGKRETADSYGLEGVDYYRLGKYNKAIAAIKKAQSMSDKPNQTWSQVLAASYAETGNTDEAVKAAKAQLAKNPDDMTTLHNAVSVLVGAGKYSEALGLMQRAHDKGLLKKGKDYILIAKLHMMKANNSDKPKPETRAALAIIKEGMDKGLIKPDYETYRIQGDAYYLSDKVSEAIGKYELAAKTAPDGQMNLQAASLLLSQGKHTAARKHARAALKQGLKHPGRAYMIIAEAERAVGNKRAAVAAMRKAEKDPTTKSKAEAWLKRANH
jgi:tetratricopeptide (TPR) repeat protein